MTTIKKYDPFDFLLNLEDRFYNEGYDLGVSDGDRAGLIEGRLFGLEKGFEKYAPMGKSYGRAVIWARRLLTSQTIPESARQGARAADTERISDCLPVGESSRGVQPETEKLLGGMMVSRLPTNMRLEKHVRMLYALTEPESLSKDNDENSVSDFDDRFNRANNKIKVIERLTGEAGLQEILGHAPSNPSGVESKARKVRKGDGGIEDISSLHARH